MDTASAIELLRQTCAGYGDEEPSSEIARWAGVAMAPLFTDACIR
jgi:hypothetical protein